MRTHVLIHRVRLDRSKFQAPVKWPNLVADQEKELPEAKRQAADQWDKRKQDAMLMQRFAIAARLLNVMVAHLKWEAR